MIPPIPKILARREISANRFLTYVEEDLTDRTGKPYTYYQVEAKWDAVLVVPILSDGRIVLERIYRHPYRAYLLEFPAGGIERGEDPLNAARRELEEETGYVAGHVQTLGVCEAMPGLLRLRLHVVLATQLTPSKQERKLEAMEMLEVEVMTVEEAWAEAEKQPTSSFLTMGLLWYFRNSR
ncbi:MAG: NUDIX hydrolase [Planctomycetes bacterium]|nr:NUDIX hydrolase [Planctomycetota bacterium]